MENEIIENLDILMNLDELEQEDIWGEAVHQIDTNSDIKIEEKESL